VQGRTAVLEKLILATSHDVHATKVNGQDYSVTLAVLPYNPHDIAREDGSCQEQLASINHEQPMLPEVLLER
jgi:hypothetical protein